MKKANKIAALLLCSLSCMAMNAITIDIRLKSDQDMLRYAKKETGALNIKTQMMGRQFWEFHTQYMVTGNDFKNQTQDGMILPVNAKVKNLSLRGYNNGGKTTTLVGTVWVQSVDDSNELEYTKGYNSYPLPAEKFKYTENNVSTTFSATSTASNPDVVQNFPFINPYVYDGKGVLLTLDQWYDGDPMNFYFLTSKCEKEVASVFRTGKGCASVNGLYYYGFRYGDVDNPETYRHVVPAFILDYYTNDIRGKVLDNSGNPIVETEKTTEQPNGYPLIRLYDVDAGKYIIPDGKTELNSKYESAEVNADGSFSFSNLDHRHTYKLAVGSNSCGFAQKTLTFLGEKTETEPTPAPARVAPNQNSIDYDLEVAITMQPGLHTGIDDIVANKHVTAVRYYNMQGIESDQPFSGINVKVVSYSDGSRTSSKIDVR